MGCGCGKTIRPATSIEPLNVPTQPTSPLGRTGALAWVLVCDEDTAIVYTDRLEAIAAAQARGCALQATRHPAALTAAS